jgi:hypothetical protein
LRQAVQQDRIAADRRRLQIAGDAGGLGRVVRLAQRNGRRVRQVVSR